MHSRSYRKSEHTNAANINEIEWYSDTVSNVIIQILEIQWEPFLLADQPPKLHLWVVSRWSFWPELIQKWNKLGLKFLTICVSWMHKRVCYFFTLKLSSTTNTSCFYQWYQHWRSFCVLTRFRSERNKKTKMYFFNREIRVLQKQLYTHSEPFLLPASIRLEWIGCCDWLIKGVRSSDLRI